MLTWWPADHSVSGERGIQVIFDRTSADVSSRGHFGVERDGVRVTAWEPPSRLAFACISIFRRRTPRTLRSVLSIRVATPARGVEIEHGGPGTVWAASARASGGEPGKGGIRSFRTLFTVSNRGEV